MSALLHRRRRNVQPRAETASQTYAAEPGKVAGLDAVRPAEETAAGERGHADEYHGIVRCSVRRNACRPVVEWVVTDGWLTLNNALG